MRKSATVVLVGVLFLTAGCRDENIPTDTHDEATPQFSSSASGDALFRFDDLVGVAPPFTGPANAIRGVRGAGRPWVVDRAEARLDEDGTLEIEVEGLVIDPNDPSAMAGRNPSPTFGGLLSCLTRGASGAVTVNRATGRFPATMGLGAGDSEIEETLTGIPDPCIAPIVFVTSEKGHWFAASGF